MNINESTTGFLVNKSAHHLYVHESGHAAHEICASVLVHFLFYFGEAIIGLRDGVCPEKIHGFTEKQQLVA